MADQPQPPAQIAVGPAPQVADQLSLSLTAPTITLTLGQARNIIGPSGSPDGGTVIEWTAAFAISPVTAVALLEALKRAVPQYEKSFGAIPKDPNFSLAVSDTPNT